MALRNLARGASDFLDSSFRALRLKRAPPGETLGTGGSRAYGGHLESNEKDSRLRGVERYRTFSEILANTAILGAGLRFHLNLLAKPSWTVEPKDESRKAAEIAERVEEALFSGETPWPRVVRRMGLFPFYGFAISEWTSKKLASGDFGFLDVEPRPQQTIERWDLDLHGHVHGVMQRRPQDNVEVYLPRQKLVYAAETSINDTADGLGIFRHCVEPARRLARYEQLEGIAYEVDLSGTPIGRGPFAALDTLVERKLLTPAQRTQYEEGIKSFVKDHVRNVHRGLLLDSSTYETTDERRSPSSVRKWDVEILKAESQGQEAVAKAIERLNREMARAMNVEHLLLGEGATGSLALAKDKTSNLLLVCESTLGDLRAVFEHDLIMPLMMLNGWPEDLAPTLKTQAIQHRDIDELTGALRNLAQAANAVGPHDEAFGELFDLMGLTRPKIEDLQANAALRGPTLIGPDGMPLPMGPDGTPLPPAGSPSGEGADEDPEETEGLDEPEAKPKTRKEPKP